MLTPLRIRALIGLLSITAAMQWCCCCMWGSGYQQKNGKWVYVSMALGDAPVDADETLEILSDPDYAKDRTKVFLYGGELKGADPATFKLDSKVRGVRYAHDKSRVYIDGDVIRGADPATFELISSNYSRDAGHIFCGTVPMNVAHPDAFEVVVKSDALVGPSQKEDIERIYGAEFADWPVEEFRFTVVPGWARDGEFWYYGPSLIEGADYATFKPIDELYAADKFGRFVGRIPEEVWLENQKKNKAVDANQKPLE